MRRLGRMLDRRGPIRRRGGVAAEGGGCRDRVERVVRRLAKGRVFHVKQPDEADATASFSFDDTPLARELADLSARRRALESTRRPAHRPDPRAHRLEPEGRRRQDDHRRQHRREPGLGRRPRARDRPRPAGKRLHRARRAAHRRHPEHLRRADRRFPLADIIQTSPESPNLLCAPSTIHLAGAEIELVSQVAREHRLRTALDEYLATSRNASTSCSSTARRRSGCSRSTRSQPHMSCSSRSSASTTRSKGSASCSARSA